MGFKAFIEGGIASIIAGALTHPLDLIKVRMQLQGEEVHLFLDPIPSPNSPNPQSNPYRPVFALNSLIGSISLLPSNPHTTTLPRVTPLAVGARILRTEGPAALFSGVSATVLRQTLYSATRLAVYDALKRRLSDPITGKFPLALKVAAGLFAGAIGAVAGNPADVAMVRMQADGSLPARERRNYRSVAHALGQIVDDEGFAGLWRGSWLTVNRAMVVTASQLATYDHVKEMVMRGGIVKDGLGTHVAASFAAGLVAAIASNPIDVVKTRMMNMKVTREEDAPPYSSALDCAVKTVRAEGPMALYKGFVPTVTRQGPFTVVLFVTLEQVRRVLKDVQI